MIETPRDQFEIDWHRFVPVCGTAPGIFGLVSSGLDSDLGPKSAIPGRILKSIPGPFSSAELWRGLLADPDHVTPGTHPSLRVAKTHGLSNGVSSLRETL